MSEKLNNIYHPSACLSQQQLFDYIDNKLDKHQRLVFEHHLLDCELCSDAMEGLSMLKNREIAFTASEKLKAEFISADKKIISINWFERNYKLMAAASVLLLIGFGIYFFQVVSNKDAQVAEVITQKPISEIEKNVGAIESKKNTPITEPAIDNETASTPKIIEKNNSENRGPSLRTKAMKPSEIEQIAASEQVTALSAPLEKAPVALDDKITRSESVVLGEEVSKNGGISSNTASDVTYSKDQEEDSSNKKAKGEEDARKISETQKSAKPFANNQDKKQSTTSERSTISQAPSVAGQTTESSDISITAPTYHGGEKAMQAFISKNKKACEGCTANVKVDFIVEADGSINNIEVKGQVATCACATIEAKRLVALMPKWNPGEVRGNKQAALTYVIITF